MAGELMAAKREQLVRLLRDRTSAMTTLLAEQKRNGEMERRRPDFLWHFLLQSFGTMGNSRGWRGLSRPENYERVAYDALAILDSAERLDRLDATLRATGVRMPSKKAQWLAKNFARIEGMGGLASARAQAFAQPGTNAKIMFLKRFDGIGDKYARNIWMDVYHPDFHNTIAIDERIKRISEVLGVSFKSYAAHEEFYIGVARDADLEPWELDRLLYNFRDDIIAALQR